jgi:hypothetical protein
VKEETPCFSEHSEMFTVDTVLHTEQVGPEQACSVFFCCLGNFGKFLSVFGQHEVQCLKYGIYTDVRIYACFCTIKVTILEMRNNIRNA